MIIMIYAICGNGLSFIPRLQREGHDVFFLLHEEIKDQQLYDGIANRVETINEGLKRNPDVIFFDMVEKGKLADDLKEAGWNVFGAGRFNDDIELDRSEGLKLMDRVGMEYPDTYEFDDIGKALKFIEKKPDRYVLKLDDNESCWSSYVSHDEGDMREFLLHIREEKLVKEGTDFILQKFVEGFEISTEGWFNGTKFIPELFNHCIEEKKFLTGGLGQTTGSEGSVVYINDNLEDELVKNVIKLEDELRASRYNGAIDVNTIVDNKGKLWALEFCARTGYVCLENFVELLESDFGQLLFDISNGDYPKLKISKDYSIGVLLSVPPYPQTDLSEKVLSKEELKKIEKILGRRSQNMLISGYDDFWESCYWSGIRQDKRGLIRTAALDGYIGAVVAKSNTLEKAQKEVYRRLEKVHLHDKQYRLDIGNRAYKWIERSK